ncbi:MAG TPA: hypothetical protein VGY57_01500, partial [Vicinamibacterales bacterium]|nr:hypothetical protein [Vicinamibacterales bacterium]
MSGRAGRAGWSSAPVVFLGSERLQHVDARGPRGRHQRRDDGGADEHGRGARDRPRAWHLNLPEESCRDARERVAARGAGGDADRG